MPSFRKRNGKWEYRVSYKDENGEYKVKSKGGFDRKREAELAAADMELALSENTNILQGDKPFWEFFEEYYKNKKESNVGIHTKNSYKRHIKLVKKYFKTMPIRSLTNFQYQKFLDEYGKTRSKGTVEKLHHELRACLKYAYSNGIIKTDPSYDVVLNYGVEAKARELLFISQKEFFAIRDYIIDRHDRYIISDYVILMTIATGARFSEVIGITFDDYNPDTQEIDINKSYEHVLTNEFKENKNEYSVRKVKIDKLSNSYLRKFRDWQLSRNNQANQDGFLFHYSNNKPVTHRTCLNNLRNISKQVGIDKKIGLHALRHTHASVLLRNKVPIEYISRRLGHADIQTALKHYIHIIEELKHESDKTVEEIFNKK